MAQTSCAWGICLRFPATRCTYHQGLPQALTQKLTSLVLLHVHSPYAELPSQQTNKQGLLFSMNNGRQHTHTYLRILNWNRTSIMQRFQSEHQHNLHTPRAVLNSVGNTIALKIAAIWLFSAKTSMLHLQLRNVKTTAKKKLKYNNNKKTKPKQKKIRPV